MRTLILKNCDRKTRNRNEAIIFLASHVTKILKHYFVFIATIALNFMGFIEVCELGLIEIMILLFKETIKLNI